MGWDWDFMCGWVAVELGRGFAPYWGVTHDQSLRQSQVCSPGPARQGAPRAPLISAVPAIVSKSESRIGAVLLKAMRGVHTRGADYAMPCRFF